MAKTRPEKQLEQLEEIIKSLGRKLTEVSAPYRKLEILESVSEGLYEEIDKLTKKAPVEPVTDLVLTQLNDIIRETKELSDDPYVQRLSEFVSAGDNPEQRDALVVLRQLRQGLARQEQKLKAEIDRVGVIQREARFIELALQIFVTEGESLDKNDFSAQYHVTIFNSWLSREYPHSFNHERLSKTDLQAYFDAKQ